MNPQDPPTKRRRTPKQLERKRERDKEIQRVKRGCDRERLEQIQLDVCSMQQQMTELQQSVHLILGPLRGRPGPSPIAAPNEKAEEPAIPAAGSSLVAGARATGPSPGMMQTHQALNQRPPQVLTAPTSTTETVLLGSIPLSPRSRSSEPAPVKSGPCVCQPRVHASYSECFEHTVYEAIMQGHSPLVPTGSLSTPPIRRLPSVCDLLFIGDGENLVTQTIMKMLKRDETVDLATLISAFLLVYWVLRYRFYPYPETFHDIPAWLRPTEIQDSTPHEIWTDFVHFPRLRNALVSGSFKCADMDEFKLAYAASLSTNWPSWQPLFVRNAGIDVVLNPDFETHISLMSNWSLDTAFALKYPEAVPLVTIRV